MFPPETMQTICARRHAPRRARRRARARRRPRRSRAPARRAGGPRRPSRRARPRARRRAAAAARSHIGGSSALAAGAVDERRRVVVVAAARRPRARQRRGARLRLDGVDTCASGSSAASALAIPVESPPPPHGTSTVSASGRSSASSSPIVPLPAITALVLHRVDEEARRRPSKRDSSRSPATSARSGTFMTRAAEALDRVELRLRRVVGHDDRRRHAALPRGPGDALRHVAGARRDDAVRPSPRRGACRIALTAPRILNEPIGCRFSSLSQISAGASDLQPDERRAHRGAGDPLARALDLGERDQNVDLGADALLAAPCATTSSAAARSSTASPSDLKTVSSSASRASRVRRRSAPRRARPRSCSSPNRRAAGSRPPRSASTRAGRRRATRRRSSPRRARARVGMLDADGVHVRSRREPVALEDRLARRRARADDVGAARAPPRASPPSRPRSTCGSPRSGSTARIASTCERACTPAPRIATPARPGRASARVATAETAAVRIAVIARGVQQRAQLAGLAVVEEHRALVRVEPARGVARGDHDLLQRRTPARAPAR